MSAEKLAYLRPLVDVLMALPKPLGATQAQAEERAHQLVLETNLEPSHAVQALTILLNLKPLESGTCKRLGDLAGQCGCSNHPPTSY